MSTSVLPDTPRATPKATPRSTPSPSRQDVAQSEASASRRKRRRVRKQKPRDEFDFNSVPGITKIALSPTLQQVLGCVVDNDVTAEKPWKYVPKYKIEDNLELHDKSSEFLPIKAEIAKYAGQELLLGYVTQAGTDVDLFYICLTEAAENEVSRILDIIQKRQEERMYNSVYRPIMQWVSLGSENDVDEMLILCNRPLLEVEVESKYPIMPHKVQFRFRLVQNANDGYTELLASRSTFNNLYKKQIDVATQVTPAVVTNEAQTVCTYPRNMWTQYHYEYDPDKNLTKEFWDNFESFVNRKMEILDDMLYVGGVINFYTTDYTDLVRDIKYSTVPQVAHVKEYTFLLEEGLCRGKQIASLSWHPLWTGIVACAYSYECPHSYMKYKPNKDVVTEAVYNITPVLLWSFKDALRPRLHLMAPREVSVISFCPYDENILIGGCVNGQVIVWDIKNRLEGVEKEEPLTAAQQRYRALMHSLMRWMKNVKDPKIVNCAAVSELEYSHRSVVSAIKWFSPFRELTKSGQLKEIPEGEDRRTLQFMTAARDGTILTWDLLAKPTMLKGGAYRPQRKLRRLKERPPALNVDVSPYKALNRVFKPLFKIHILEPNTNRSLPIAALSIRRTKALSVEKYPSPNRKFDITERIYFKPTFNRPTHPLLTKVIVGTTEGDFIIAGWEGFAFNAGEVVNQEVSTIDNYGKYHDGPVVSLSRSELFPDLSLTVGGKVFALWKSDFIGKPVLWKRSKYKYTSGVWNSYRPSIFRLTRADGHIEMWHLKTRSDRYQDIKFICGLGVTGSSTHPLPLQQNVMGISDSNGALRLFFVAHNLTQATEEDKWSTYRLCEREAIRKEKFLKWQADWIAKHADLIQERKQKEALLREQLEERNKMQKEKTEEENEQIMKAEEDRLALLQTPQPGHYEEWANRQWLTREKGRMNRVLLGKKALDINILEKQQLPLLKEVRDEQQKKVKQEKRLKDAPKILEDTVAMLFPDAIKKREPSPPDPYGGGDPVDVKLKYFREYQQLEQRCQEYVSSHEHVHHFDWIQVLQAGRERRKVLDGGYSRYNHKLRLLREKIARGGLPLPPTAFRHGGSASSSGPSAYTNSTDSEF
ncbi:hypothetical protein ILUMI_26044 [Ignelater luminosus]|uniref:WD repeat-containing protein 63 n=1 Tax=Ignelater luminosus TaxID=2038154 RepID=A0A8K0C4Q0_IGNLU|nr:hypothetical protein ILUMI_26044 [Ignelater luminosus]